MTDRIDIQNVLSQMRTMKMQSQNMAEVARVDQMNPAHNPNSIHVNSVDNTPSFSELMSNAVNTVNDLQKESGRLSNALERGQEGVTLTQAMVASQKASVAFEAVSEARNKLIGAYEKIMNMPV